MGNERGNLVDLFINGGERGFVVKVKSGPSALGGEPLFKVRKGKLPIASMAAIESSKAWRKDAYGLTTDPSSLISCIPIMKRHSLLDSAFIRCHGLV